MRSLVRGGSRGTRLGFVRTGSIEPGHGNTNQAEIDRKLRAMMNQVVEAHSADARHAGHGEDFLAASQQLSTFHRDIAPELCECSAFPGQTHQASSVQWS